MTGVRSYALPGHPYLPDNEKCPQYIERDRYENHDFDEFQVDCFPMSNQMMGDTRSRGQAKEIEYDDGTGGARKREEAHDGQDQDDPFALPDDVEPPKDEAVGYYHLCEYHDVSLVGGATFQNQTRTDTYNAILDVSGWVQHLVRDRVAKTD